MRIGWDLHLHKFAPVFLYHSHTEMPPACETPLGSDVIIINLNLSYFIHKTILRKFEQFPFDLWRINIISSITNALSHIYLTIDYICHRNNQVCPQQVQRLSFEHCRRDDRPFSHDIAVNIMNWTIFSSQLPIAIATKTRAGREK